MPACEDNSLADIEDILGGDVFSQAERLAAKPDVVPRVRKRKTDTSKVQEIALPEQVQADR